MTTLEKDAVLHSLDNILLGIADGLRRDSYKKPAVPGLEIVEIQLNHDNFAHRADRLFRSAMLRSTVDTSIPTAFEINDHDLHEARNFAKDFILP